jgi:hypothetical protein
VGYAIRTKHYSIRTEEAYVQMSEIEECSSNPVAAIPHGDDSGKQLWLVAIFAHNEELQIIACLESLAKASATHLLHAYVLAIGCNDHTETVVRDFALTHPWVTLISLTLGDKANAWNVFVHDIAPRAQV